MDQQLKNYIETGGEILACGTCLRSRQLQGSKACPISITIDCVNAVVGPTKQLPFN